MISNQSVTSYNSEEDIYESVQEVSEISTPRLKSDLSNVSKLADFVKQTKNSENEENKENLSQKTFVERTQQVEDFLRNFLMKNNLNETLKQFQTEWYQIKTLNKNKDSEFQAIPDIYLENQNLHEQISHLQKELDEAKIFANKTKLTWEKLKKERDFHKLHHSRVQQEKEKLIKQIEKLKGFHLHYEQKYQELASKYEGAMKDKMLLKLEKDKLISKNEGLAKTIKIMENKVEEQNPKLDMNEKDQSLSQNFSREELKVKKNPLFSQVPKNLENPYEMEKIQPLLHKQIVPIKTFKGHMQAISKIKIHEKKPFLATASDDMTWKIWSLPKGELIMSGEGHNDWISDVAFHPLGTHLATASGDCTIKIWDFLNISCAWTIKSYSQPIWSLDFHFSGDFLIAGGMDHSCRLFDVPYQKSRYNFRGHVDSVNKVLFSKYTSVFYSGSTDKTVSLWDIRSGLLTQTFYGHVGSINSLCLSENENDLVSCDSDGLVKVWDLKMMKQRGEIDCGPYSANGIALDPSADLGFIASDDCSIHVVDLKTFKVENNLKGHEDQVQDLVFDPFNKQLVSCSSDMTFRTWG